MKVCEETCPQCGRREDQVKDCSLFTTCAMQFSDPEEEEPEEKEIDDNQRGCKQITDLIPGNVIENLCDMHCLKGWEHCRFSVKKLGSTLMSPASYYDQEGNLVYSDWNRRKDYICCSYCWKDWIVKSEDGEITEIKHLKSIRK